MNNVTKIFGATIRVCRNRRGFSQETLAEHANLHRTYISDVERGTRNLSLQSIVQLADALQVSVASLFPPELQSGKLICAESSGRQANFGDAGDYSAGDK